jgi:hypothetical protein
VLHSDCVTFQLCAAAATSICNEVGDRGGVHIEGRNIGGTPLSARWHKALKASPHLVVLANKAPDRLAAEAGMLVEDVERHATGSSHRRYREVADPRLFTRLGRQPDERGWT